MVYNEAIKERPKGFPCCTPSAESMMVLSFQNGIEGKGYAEWMNGYMIGTKLWTASRLSTVMNIPRKL